MNRVDVPVVEFVLGRLGDLAQARCVRVLETSGRVSAINIGAALGDWLDLVAERWAQGEAHPDVQLVDVPEVRASGRVDPRGTESVIMLAREPALALGLDVPDGATHIELDRIRRRFLRLSDGTRPVGGLIIPSDPRDLEDQQ